MDNYESRIEQFRRLLTATRRVAVLTGAGMSTESGVPDFRSSTGIYKTLCSEEVFDIDNFNREPGNFYRIMAPIYAAMLDAVPNAGHLGLAQLEKSGRQVLVATQNIDELHQRAGSKVVKEVHGTLMTLTCRDCGMSLPLGSVESAARKGVLLTHNLAGSPCHGVLKPDIVFYGEGLPMDAFESSAEAFSKADMVLVMGTSLAVYPAAELPRYRRRGSHLVIVNRTETPLDSEAEIVFREDIGRVMADAVQGLA